MLRKSLAHSKKGSLLDLFPIMIIAFVTFIVLIISYKVWIEVDDSGMFLSDSDANNAMKNTQRTLLAWDNMTIMIFIFLSLVTIILASQIASHPAWFFMALFVIVIAFIVAVAMSNASESVYNSEGLNESSHSFPKTKFLMDNLPIYIMVMGFLICMAMYIGIKFM